MRLSSFIITYFLLFYAISGYTQDLSLGIPKEGSNSTDVIICPLVLHYIEELSVFFKEVSRVLKVGGYIVFSTHHPFADFECSSSGNYFEREIVNDVWDTVGKPVKITFYRRSLTEIMNAITRNGLVVTKLTEGQVSAKVKDISPVSKYKKISFSKNSIQ